MLSFVTKLLPQAAIARLREKLQHSPLARRLAKGAMWSLIGAVLSRLLTVASTAIIVRLLGKESFGEFGMVHSTLAMLGTFAGLGLGLTATKYTAEFRTQDPDKVGRILTLIIATAVLSGLAMTIAGWASSGWIADRLLERDSLALYLRVSSVLVLIGALDGVFSSALAGFEAFASIARRSIFVAAISPLVTVPLVYAYGVYGAVVGLVFAMTLQMVLDGMAVRRECRFHHVPVHFSRVASSEWPVLVHYTLPAFAASILVMPATWLANVLLVRSGNGEGYAELGVVNVVNTLKSLTMYLPTILLAPTLAVLSNVVNDPVSVRKTLRYALGMSALAVLPVALVITALGKHILSILYGSDFAAEGMALAFAMIVAGIQATGAGLGSYISATGRMWLGLSINVLWGLSFIGLSIALIPRFGALGYLGAMALAYFVSVLVVYGGFSWKSPDLVQCYPIIRALALFSVLMGAAVYGNRSLSLPAAAGLALVLGVGMAVAVAAPLAPWWKASVPTCGGNPATNIHGGPP